MASTTIKYTRFSFNYIDSPLFQERMAQILAGEVDPRDVNWDVLLGDNGIPIGSSNPPSSNDADHEHDLFHGFSLGLFIPLVICCTFLFVLAICVIRHSMNKRCTPISKSSFSSVFRGATGYHDTSRNSTRSNTPLKRKQDERQSTRTNASKTKVPIFTTRVSRLGSIRESPEDFYKKFCDKGFSASGTITPDSMSSMSSLFSRLTTGEPPLNVLSNSAMYPATEKIPTPIPVLTRSFPNLIQTMQNPKDALIHPYRITWITPMSAQSEPVLVDHLSASNLERRLFAKLEKKNQLADVNVLSSTSANNTSKLSDKSPFHPNNNTPTTGSDGDNIPGDVFINQTHSIIANDSHNNTAGTPSMVTMNTSLSRRQIRSIGSTPGTEYSQPSLRSVSLSFPNTSIGSWHYNDIYRADKQPGLVKNILSHTKALMANPSPYPPPMPANNESNVQNNNRGNDMSMYPNIGSSNTSMSHQTSENQLMNKILPTSGNTSICAHMDSNETSQTYNSSMFTGVNSDLAFGYDQSHERGHSTSIEQGPDSMINAADATTTSNNIRALSAIQGNGSSAFESGSLTACVPSSGEESNEPSFASTTRSAPAVMMKKFLSSMRSDTPTVMSRTDTSSGINAHQQSSSYSTTGMSNDGSYQQQLMNARGGEGICANDAIMGGRDDDLWTPDMISVQQADSSTETPASTKSLEWDGYFYYTDQSDADRRGSSGTVRDMDLENARLNLDDPRRRSQNKIQAPKRLSDQMLQHQLQKRMSGQYLSANSSGSSGEPNRRKSDISAYSSQSSAMYSDQLSRDDVKRHSAQAVLIENYRRRSDQPVLDAKQYWV